MKNKGLIFGVSKATLIGEILLAKRDGREILAGGERIGVNAESLFENIADDTDLLENPERWSIKPEPRVIWLNVYKDYSTSWNTEETAKAGADHEEAERVAVRIELPEDV